MLRTLKKCEKQLPAPYNVRFSGTSFKFLNSHALIKSHKPLAMPFIPLLIDNYVCITCFWWLEQILGGCVALDSDWSMSSLSCQPNQSQSEVALQNF